MLSTGHKIVPADEEHSKILKSKFTGFAPFEIQFIEPGHILVSSEFEKKCSHMFNLKVRPSDIFVNSYLKVGSTWMQEVIWGITHNANLDHPEASRGTYFKSPWIEAETVLPPCMNPKVFKERDPKSSFYEMIDQLPDPRVLQTHVCFDLLDPEVLTKAKSVYIIRDPYDVCLSYYKFASGVKLYGYVGTLEQFVDDFIAGDVFMGRYVDHLRHWWELRDSPNLYTIYYEDIKLNPKEEIGKLASFLGYPLTDQQIKNVCEYTSFESMKKRDPLAESEDMHDDFLFKNEKGFFRKGVSGDAKSEMTPELKKKIAESFRQRMGDIKLPYNFDL